MFNIENVKNVKVEIICSFNELENGFDIVKFVWNYNGKMFIRIVRNDFDYGGSFGGSELVWGEDYNCEDGKDFVKFVDSLSEMGISNLEDLDNEELEEYIIESGGE